MTERRAEEIVERAGELAGEYEKTYTGCAQSCVTGLLDETCSTAGTILVDDPSPASVHCSEHTWSYAAQPQTTDGVRTYTFVLDHPRVAQSLAARHGASVSLWPRRDLISRPTIVALIPLDTAYGIIKN